MVEHPDIRSPSFIGLIGVARREITPPAGIYARSWGASTHDIADGVHRPLTLTAMTFQSDTNQPPLVLISADLMSWRSREAEDAVIGRVLRETSLPRQNLLFCLTHTHSGPSVRPDDAGKPGGHLIAAYHEQLATAAKSAIDEATANAKRATLIWRYGRCDLATNRDLREPGGERLVLGFNPAQQADDTLLVGRITDDANGRVIGTIVNYACHATTLAWDNRLISPDFVGAMRETIESPTDGAPCLFLQGASGELSPAEQYSGDVQLADRHGRRLAHAVMATLEAMGPAGTELAYDHVVESGAPLAVWKRRPHPSSATSLAATFRDVQLPLKPMPSVAELEDQMRQTDDPIAKERISRKRQLRKIVGDGSTSPMPLVAWRLGDALLIGQPNEAYSIFQTELRERFASRPIAVINLANGSAGYLPPREMYAENAYSVWQTPFAVGSLEVLLEAASGALKELA